MTFPTNTFRWVVVAAGVALTASSGCSRDAAADRPPLYPVSGRATVKGAPAAGVTVSLHSTDHRHGVLPTAVTGPDGSFTLGSYAAADGAPEGDYVVTAVWRQSVDSGSDAPEVDRLGGRYIDPARSQLRVHVGAEPTLLAPLDFR